MPDRPLFTKSAALVGADVIALSIVNALATPAIEGVVRLFDDSFVPDEGTTRAELIAAETTLTGYPAGGYVLDAPFAAQGAPLGGAVVTFPIVNVAYASGPTVVIGGYWVETDTSGGLVREVFIYDPPRTLAVVGDGWPIAVQLGYGANASI